MDRYRDVHMMGLRYTVELHVPMFRVTYIAEGYGPPLQILCVRYMSEPPVSDTCLYQPCHGYFSWQNLHVLPTLRVRNMAEPDVPMVRVRYTAEQLSRLRHGNGRRVCQLYGAHAEVAPLGACQLDGAHAEVAPMDSGHLDRATEEEFRGQNGALEGTPTVAGAVGQGPVVGFSILRADSSFVGYRSAQIHQLGCLFPTLRHSLSLYLSISLCLPLCLPVSLSRVCVCVCVCLRLYVWVPLSPTVTASLAPHSGHVAVLTNWQL
jgi:hypothetical protein